MILEVARLVAATTLLVLLPGYLLVSAALPPARTNVRGLERAYLSLAGGVLLLMLVGVLLGFLPHGQRGWFSTGASGAPIVEFAMAAVCVLLFYIGLSRGAFPKLSARFPRLVRPEGVQMR